MSIKPAPHLCLGVFTGIILRRINKNITFTKKNMSKISLSSVKKAAVGASAAVTVFLFNTVPAMAQLISPGDAPGRIADATGGQGSLRDLVLTFLNFFLGFLGIIAVIMIIYGGILYVTAAGNQESIDKGKKIILYSIIGIVIILLSFALVNTVLGGLGAGGDQ
ncbi:hypothetical protein GF340_02850 [Candidatus Peregrinibacteria bacterium]|nr:hypothetical protein [Candidatus Peregrinibacteria bacterium]